ncbi:MAG: YiiG family protein [Candidatus Altimarinota bacterium]
MDKRSIALIVAIIVAVAGYFGFSQLPQAQQLFSGDFSSISNMIEDTANSVSSTTGDFELSTDQQAKLTQETGFEAKLAKMNAYVDFLNYVSGNVEDSYNRYGQWVVDYEAGPTGQERIVYGLYALNDYSFYQEAAEEVIDSEPLLPIDSIVKEYLIALNELAPKIEEAYIYYDQENYKDDNFAKGKAMHPGLMAGFAKFKEVSDRFRAEYDVLFAEQRTLDLQRFKDEGRELAYQSTNTLASAEALYLVLENHLFSSPDAQVETLNYEDFKAKLDIFEKNYNDLKAFSSSNPAEIEEEFGYSGESNFGSYLSQSEAYLKNAKILYRKLRDKEEIEKGTFATMTDGTPESLLEDYNELIYDYNYMQKF